MTEREYSYCIGHSPDKEYTIPIMHKFKVGEHAGNLLNTDRNTAPRGALSYSCVEMFEVKRSDVESLRRLCFYVFARAQIS